MRVIEVRNVCEALPIGVEYLTSDGELETSRAGDVLVSPVPVTTVYAQPTERVLFSAVRDANPFFHMYEAIWMLAGRSNVQPLLRYVRDFDKFAEDNGEMHGAYGHRWRSALGLDQLDAIVGRLRAEPGTRQAVLQMWDASDYGMGSVDLTGSWKDRPCNTTVYFRIRGGVLDMTVCCRSNDIVLGAYGANAVHFSVLQEYMAARVGARVGVYYQISNNYHLYVQQLSAMRNRILRREDDYGSHGLYGNPYLLGEVTPSPMFTLPEYADEDILQFSAWHDEPDGARFPVCMNPWFSETAVPAALAHLCYRETGSVSSAVGLAATIRASDWRRACVEWLQRRAK